MILKSLDFLGSVPNWDHVGANLSVSRHIFLGRWVGGLSLIRQIFAVMIGDQGEVDASIPYTGGSAMNADQLREKWIQFKGELKHQ